MTRIRLKVKEVAQAKGISMGRLSHLAFMSLNTIRSIYQNPYRTINTDTLIRLADALEVPVFDLMEVLPDDGARKEEDMEVLPHDGAEKEEDLEQ